MSLSSSADSLKKTSGYYSWLQTGNLISHSRTHLGEIHSHLRQRHVAGSSYTGCCERWQKANRCRYGHVIHAHAKWHIIQMVDESSDPQITWIFAVCCEFFLWVFRTDIIQSTMPAAVYVFIELQRNINMIHWPCNHVESIVICAKKKIILSRW